MMVDSDDVLLLRPLDPRHAIPVLPAVDPVAEPSGARGVVVAQVFPVQAHAMQSFVTAAESAFNAYREAGARDASILVTLDERNNFPQLPVRTDGPFVVWLGVFEDAGMVESRVRPAAARAAASLKAAGLLRGDADLLVLKPAPRSRLRWLAR
jgi:hypothetical protein